jgi:hypothetical protein
MKLDEGDRIVGVASAPRSDDVLLTTAQGQPMCASSSPAPRPACAA